MAWRPHLARGASGSRLCRGHPTHACPVTCSSRFGAPTVPLPQHLVITSRLPCAALRQKRRDDHVMRGCAGGRPLASEGPPQRASRLLHEYSGGSAGTFVHGIAQGLPMPCQSNGGGGPPGAHRARRANRACAMAHDTACGRAPLAQHPGPPQDVCPAPKVRPRRTPRLLRL
jgi:hypothetical protein